MTLPATIQTAVGQSLIGCVSRMFNGSIGDVLSELLQNARRAGATRVDIDHFDLANHPTLVIRDNGGGIDDPTVLVTLGDSGWNSEIASREDPAGMGVFSLAGHRVEVRSFSRTANAGWRVVIAPDAWETGAPLLVEPFDIAEGTEILIDMPDAWGKQLEAATTQAALYYPIAVRFQNKVLTRHDFLADAIRVEERHGYRIGIFKDRNSRSIAEPRINFHGLTIPTKLPCISEVNDQSVWCARVDIVDAPQLQLVLPARKEVVQNAALDALRDAVETAIYRTIATIGSHRLSHADWMRADSLEVTLPEAAPYLRAWLPRTAENCRRTTGQRVAGERMIRMPEQEPEIEQCAARILGDGKPIGGALVDEVAAFEGYGWYDRLERISAIRFKVDSDAGVYPYSDETPLSARIESGRVESIVLELALHDPAAEPGDDEVYEYPVDLLIAFVNSWCSGIDQAIILFTDDAGIAPDDLVELLEASCFSPGDDHDDDSWDSQYRYFNSTARHLANTLILGSEQAAVERIREVAYEQLCWLLPENREVMMRVTRNAVTLSCAPDGTLPTAGVA